jgi:hypothetical protein
MVASFIDFTFIGELALILTAILQVLKSVKGIAGSKIPPLSAPIGVACGVLWYLVSGDLHNSHAFISVDWMNLYRGVSGGFLAAMSSTAGYEVQKNLPLPNILPTASEMRTSYIKEETQKQQLVVEAVQQGLEPEKAKDVLGLPQDTPPPNAELEKVQGDKL